MYKGWASFLTHSVHHFSDASEDGYGCISYIRYEDDEGNICVSFLMSKSRVTPLKHVTIPRLELQAAVLSIENDR
jgi:V8-like Glu-specific endopeptidase